MMVTRTPSLLIEARSVALGFAPGRAHTQPQSLSGAVSLRSPPRAAASSPIHGQSRLALHLPPIAGEPSPALSPTFPASRRDASSTVLPGTSPLAPDKPCA